MKIKCKSCGKVTKLDEPLDDDLCKCGTILQAEDEVKPKEKKD